jgi:hypothetical protein
VNRRLPAAGLILIVALAATAQQAHVEFRNGVFRLIGWSGGPEVPASGWESVFAVYAGNADTPMLGSYAVDSGALTFKPRFPISPGVSYRAVFAGGSFTTDPARLSQTTSTSVEHVYPSTEILPANILRLYVYFSAPMSRGEAWQHLHLLDDGGKPVEHAFLEIEPELWDPDNRRLTVLFDPGRIKRGLVPQQQLGTPVVEGKSYTLMIDSDWRDARGVPLKQNFRKSFRGGPADRTPSDPKLWRLIAPRAGTREPLQVDFPKPMDYALLQRLIEVSGTEGDVSVERNETRWRFTPHLAWQPGEHHLVADNTLEDISGNRPGRPFEVDLSHTRERETAATKTVIPFRLEK